MSLVYLPSGKLTWQWKMDHLKMYFLLNMGIFHFFIARLVYWRVIPPSLQSMANLDQLFAIPDLQRLMEKILHQLTYKPLQIMRDLQFAISTGGGFLPSTVEKIEDINFHFMFLKAAGREVPLFSRFI